MFYSNLDSHRSVTFWFSLLISIFFYYLGQNFIFSWIIVLWHVAFLLEKQYVMTRLEALESEKSFCCLLTRQLHGHNLYLFCNSEVYWMVVASRLSLNSKLWLTLISWAPSSYPSPMTRILSRYPTYIPDA